MLQQPKSPNQDENLRPSGAMPLQEAKDPSFDTLALTPQASLRAGSFEPAPTGEQHDSQRSRAKEDASRAEPQHFPDNVERILRALQREDLLPLRRRELLNNFKTILFDPMLTPEKLESVEDMCGRIFVREFKILAYLLWRRISMSHEISSLATASFAAALKEEAQTFNPQQSTFSKAWTALGAECTAHFARLAIKFRDPSCLKDFWDGVGAVSLVTGGLTLAASLKLQFNMPDNTIGQALSDLGFLGGLFIIFAGGLSATFRPSIDPHSPNIILFERALEKLWSDPNLRALEAQKLGIKLSPGLVTTGMRAAQSP
jgi:hypothetical protein